MKKTDLLISIQTIILINVVSVISILVNRFSLIKVVDFSIFSFILSGVALNVFVYFILVFLFSLFTYFVNALLKDVTPFSMFLSKIIRTFSWLPLFSIANFIIAILVLPNGMKGMLITMLIKFPAYYLLLNSVRKNICVEKEYSKGSSIIFLALSLGFMVLLKL